MIRVGHKIMQTKELGLWGIDYNLQTEVQLQSTNSLYSGGQTSAEMWFVIWYGKAREGW